MKCAIASLIGALSFIFPGQAEAKSKEAQFTFTNEYSKPVEITLLDSNGKVLDKRSLAPAKEIKVGSVRRVLVHIDEIDREYALPSVLRVRAIEKGSAVQYVGMLGGKWRLTIKKSEQLEIACIQGGDVGQAVDLTTSPLGFPLLPRRSNETFEQYKARLDSHEQAILRKSTAPP
jgi:hypothetical protein